VGSELIARDGAFAVELVDVGYAVDEQVPSGRGHPRRSGGVAPLQKVAVTTDGGGRIGLAGGETQHHSLEIGCVLRISHSADNALYARLGLLEVPDFHFLAERDALGQRSQITAGSVNLFELDIDFEWTFENRMIERLSMSRIS